MKALGIVSVAVELTVESSVVYTGFSTLRISSLGVSKLDVFYQDRALLANDFPSIVLRSHLRGSHQILPVSVSHEDHGLP